MNGVLSGGFPMHTSENPHKPMKISRREVLKAMAIVAGGVALNHVRIELGNSQAKGDESVLNTEVYLPLVTKYGSKSVGKVVHVHAQNATTWSGQSSYWEHVEQGVVNEMVNRGVVELTGAATVANAWQELLPGYQPGRKIALKVNFNNCQSCSSTSAVIDALIHPVNAVVNGLEQIGVVRADVCVFDAIRALPDRFVNAGLPGISYFDSYCGTNAGFSNQLDAYITFNPPPSMIMPAEKITDVVRNADYLINMPIMKGGHPLAGVTLGFKNHFGTIHNCGALHDYVDVVHKPPAYNQDYNPMVDFFSNPHIGGKTVLTIGDALFAAKIWSYPPEPWTTFGDKVPNSLFFSRDPVAIDCVMHDFIAAELGDSLTKAANRYLVLAGRTGIGVYESVNPWIESYTQINYTKIKL
jgi:hypothetical protein